MPVVLFATRVLIKVVRGVMTIEPPTALMVILLAKPVVMSVPPVITKLPVPPTRVNPPVESVTAEASPLFKTPSLLASANTVAPEM